MRRLHVPEVRPGLLTPDAAQSHHLTNVLRLTAGDVVEVFDSAGRTAVATIESVSPSVMLRVDAVEEAAALSDVVVAAAVPKGDRAEWMIEKLSELGVSRYVPLRTARSVVHPEGRGKLERWERIAVESAKQCRRPGVMTIEPLTPVNTFLATLDPATSYYLSTQPASRPFLSLFAGRRTGTLLIGPEGDWTADEEAAFAARGLTAAGLGRTILRVETAAILAAGLATQIAALDHPAP